MTLVKLIITMWSLMAWYPKIPDNIQWVVSHFKTFLGYFRGPSILNVLQVETAMPGFLHAHYGAIRKKKLHQGSAVTALFPICRASWNLPPSLLPVSLFFLISLSSLSLLTLFVISGVHWSLVERFRDLGHSDLTGSYSRQVWRTNNP